MPGGQAYVQKWTEIALTYDELMKGQAYYLLFSFNLPEKNDD